MRKKMISLMMTVAMGTVMISGATVVKADSDEKETVKLAVWSSGAADNFQKGADEFNKRQDKINFVVEMQSGDYSQYLGAKVASNDLPDMFFLNPYSQVQQFAATGRIVDLSEEGFATKIYDSVKDACSYDGKIYAYPMAVEMLGVYYNQELFEKAGITEVPKTFSQMKEVCEKLQASGITPFAATYKDAWTLNHLFSCLQGAAVGDYESWVADMNAGKGSFRNDNSSLEFEFMDMMKENSGGNYMDADSTSGFNAFASGEAAMIVTGEFSLLNAQSINPDLQVGLFGVPLTENEEDAKLKGKVVILCDNSPEALILPGNFSSFMESSEDWYHRFEMASFLRILRYLAVIMATVLPGLYLAVIRFHTQILPSALILSFAEAREGVPFSSVVELIFLELAFELIREAGVRVPGSLGNAIGIVGGLVIGQAAVEANLVSPIVVMIVALTALGSMTVPNEEFAAAFRLVKYGFLILGGYLGIYGIVLGVYLVIGHLAGLISFGIPYLVPFIKKEQKGSRGEGILRVPLRKRVLRPLYAREEQKIRLKRKESGS